MEMVEGAFLKLMRLLRGREKARLKERGLASVGAAGN